MAIFSEVLAAQAAGRSLRIAQCLYMDFVSGALRSWNGIGDLATTTLTAPTYGSGGAPTLYAETWMGTGDILKVSDVDAAAGFYAATMQVSLNGLLVEQDEFLRNAFKHETEYKGRRIVYKAQFLADDWQPLDHAFALWAGIMSDLVLEKDVVSRTLSLQCETSFVTRSRARNVYYTDQDQQARFPGDKGLRFVPAASDKLIV
jgi:hypothetical protein